MAQFVVERWGGQSRHKARVLFIGSEDLARDRYLKEVAALRQGEVRLIDQAQQSRVVGLEEAAKLLEARVRALSKQSWADDAVRVLTHEIDAIRSLASRPTDTAPISDDDGSHYSFAAEPDRSA